MEIKSHGNLNQTHGPVSPFAHFGPRTGILLYTEHRLAAVSLRKPAYWIPNIMTQITLFLSWLIRHKLDVRGSAQLSKFIKKNPTRCKNVSKFYYSTFKWSSTCFGRHTAHHQEPKTALAASGFS